MTEEYSTTGTGVPERIIDRLRKATGVERVFGEPIERGGQTIVPVASVRAGGGGGGGGGSDERTTGSGEGGGFGAVSRAAGVYVITESNVKWKPAIDVTRLVVAGNFTAVAYFFFAWLTARAKSKRR